jgi:hypothetical protein
MFKRVLYVDYLAPVGHIALNNYIIDNYSKGSEKHLISKKNYLSKIDCYCTKIAFLQFNFPSKIIHHLNSILALIQIVFIQKKYDHIIFLSFENRAFPIFSYLIYKTKSAIIHNNLDHNKFRRLNLISITNKKLILIAFEKFILEYIQLKYNFKNFKRIDHPIRTNFDSQIHSKRDIVFAPGNANRYDTRTQKKIEKYLEENNLKLITKTPLSNSNSERIIMKEYFRDIDYYYYSSKWVLINCNYHHRVSGIFYEAIGAECSILYCDESLFMQEMRRKYPTRVYHINELISE